MFTITFLGTAATMPSRPRGLPAVLIEHRDRRFLVDCGEGTQRQIVQAGLGFRRLDRVLLTHTHLDHVLGLAGLAATLALLGPVEALAIHGGSLTLSTARKLLDLVW